MSGTRIETVVLSLQDPVRSWARFRLPSDGAWTLLNGITDHTNGGRGGGFGSIRMVDHTASVGGMVEAGTFFLARPLQLETVSPKGESLLWVDLSGEAYTAWSLSFLVDANVPPWDVSAEEPIPNSGIDSTPSGPRIIRPDAKWNF